MAIILDVIGGDAIPLLGDELQPVPREADTALASVGAQKFPDCIMCVVSHVSPCSTLRLHGP